MKNKDIEKQIKNEIEAHSPSFESVLSKCKKDTDNINKEKCLVPVTAGVPTRLQTSRSVLKYVLPVALIAVLTIIVIFMCLPQNTSQLSGGYFVIDINPSIEISYDKDGNVLAVTALNEDAEVLLYELNFNGKSYTEAIELIVDNCITLGYLSSQRDDNAILTTAISEQGVKDEIMTEKIRKVFSDTLTQKKVTGEVLTGVQDEELNKEAEKYGIDGQKLSLIQKYIDLGGEINEEQYSEITIRELYYSISQKEKDVKAEKIDNLKNEAAQLENELFDKIAQGLEGLKDIIPEDSELKARLDEVSENANKDGTSNYIESLINILGSVEDGELGFIMSGLKTELESKNEEFKKANDQLTELNKTVEEKKNDRLNNENETEKNQDDKSFIDDVFGGLFPSEESKNDLEQENATEEKPNSDAHFPKEDEHLPHTKPEQNEASIEENNPTEDNPPVEKQNPTIEEIPSMEESPVDGHKPHRNKR